MNNNSKKMEVDSPFPKFAKGKRFNISPIPKRLFFNDNDEETTDDFQERLAAVQRRLSFDNNQNENSMILDENISDDVSGGESSNSHYDTDSSKTMDSDSPPYKKVKSQNLFDSSTPFNGRTTPPSKNASLLSATTTPMPTFRRTKIQTSPLNSTNIISRSLNAAPVNPFTPTGRIIVSENQKRKQKHRKAFQEWLNRSNGEDSIQNTSKSDSDGEFDDKSIVGTSLSDLETSRFAEEFKVDTFIASGSYGYVYKCTNYLDGMEYAIKKSARQVAGTKDERYARKEVFAHAALKSHPHIVAYYSSWIEDGHLFIQTEYCNGGSLDTLISHKKMFTECGLMRLANHVAKGLKHIHSLRLAHMDIKPSNILVNKVDVMLSSDEDLEEVDRDDIDIVYKIGDLGHVVLFDEQIDVEDGDCRYMPKELLNENFECLQKADVFAFGMTLYEAAGGGPLPKNGGEWQQLRSGEIPYLNKYSSAFNQIIRNMLHPEPEKRPDVRCILQKTRTASDVLQQQLFSWKVKADFFTQQVKSKLSSFMDNNHSPVICPPDNIPKIFIEEV